MPYKTAPIEGVAPAFPSMGPAGQIVVLKVGTSSLVNPEQQRFNLSALARIVETVKSLHSMGHFPIIVTSGAVGVGCHRLGLAQKPSKLPQKQALAAVGQVHLMKFYEDFLNTVGLTCAQVLVTLDNLAVRGQYINVRNTFRELLNYGVIPVVNENDSTSIQKLRFGDNDTLAAHVAALVQANWLFLMTDVDHLYTANPKTNPGATPIYEVHDMFELNADTSTQGTQWGTGGMATKLTAARIATAAGTTLVILNSNQPELITEVIKGREKIGTKFYPIKNALKGRKRWILSVPVRGQVWMDSKAVKSVKDKHKSLFCPGITKVVGNFQMQDAVQLCDEDGTEFARGLINFTSDELKVVKGRMWNKVDIEEVLHRDNITLIGELEHEPEQRESIVGQLLWLEKLAADGDAEMLAQQLEDLGGNDDTPLPTPGNSVHAGAAPSS